MSGYPGETMAEAVCEETGSEFFRTGRSVAGSDG
jgi:hypothetical protein